MSKTEKGICSVGGDWYTCTAQSPTFFGCCTNNPCRGDNTGCSASHLRAAGIGSGKNPDATPNGTYWPNVQCAKGQWWTCDTPQQPTFQGCCDVNPCNGVGCPAGSLQQAAFRTVPAELSPTTKSTSTSPTSSATQNPNPSPIAGSSGNSSPNIGAIAGGAAGGIVILIVGLAILWVCRRRRQKKFITPGSPVGGLNDSSNGLAGISGQSRANESKSHKSARFSLLGIPFSSKYAPVSMSSPPVSPGPPPYKTPQQSTNPNIHEIDSTHLHKVGVVAPPSATIQALHLSPISHELDSAATQSHCRSSDQLAELPNLAGGSKRSSRKSTDSPIVEIGDGTPRSSVNTPVSALLSSGVSGRDGRGDNATTHSSTLTPVSGMRSPHLNDSRLEGRESYVSWQILS
ncbi:hypothetical protein IFR05_011359 [Cadophora sp. M221]|nr:hypothetical protein IFR05_011359 [Cadophora sp. M221]